ncbi:hypothetical protein HDU67_008215 [Dinochytrium kinnereticum]|nr:hypothetical protein HDU67_008215 [Dinochytrium kinnereticum]
MGRTIAGVEKERVLRPQGKMLKSVRGDSTMNGGATIQQVNVDDFTNWSSFWSLMEVTIWATVDSILWTVVNVLITVVFAVIAPPWFFLQQFALMFRIPQRLGMNNSAVTASTPEIYNEYLDELKEKDWKLCDTVVQKLSGSSKFDYDVASLFLHLSALIYEPTAAVEKFQLALKERIPDITFIRFGREGCCVLSVFSVTRNFVIVVFKGTSPFDLTEWLTDASMRKSAARNGVLPGLVHTGFYTNFGFPANDLITRPTPSIDLKFKESLDTGIPIDLSTLWRGVDDVNDTNHINGCSRQMWTDCFYPHLVAIRSQFGRDVKPDFWVTGHSLGAATATIFSSTLLWKRTEVGRCATVPTMDWDLWFKIHGAYTFGTPRVADTDFQQAIEAAMHHTVPKFQFYRVINANDIVCSVPGISQTFGSFLRLRKKLPYTQRLQPFPPQKPAGVTLSDFQHVGVPVYVGFRSGGIWYRPRRVWDVMWNMGVEVPVGLWEMVTEGGWLAKAWNGGVAGTWGVAGEYLRNLKAAREKNPSGPIVTEHGHHF